MVEVYNWQTKSNKEGWVILTEHQLLTSDTEDHIGQKIYIQGHLYNTPNPPGGSYTEIPYPGEQVTLIGGPILEDNPNTGWEDIWWQIEYSGGTAWINRDLGTDLSWAQDGAGYDCDSIGNAFICVDGHGVMYSAGW